MYTTDSLVVLSAASLAGLAMLAVLFAWSWRQWLDYKRRELDAAAGGGPAAPGAASRIELADLRARLKKLEAIAAGVDF